MNKKANKRAVLKRTSIASLVVLALALLATGFAINVASADAGDEKGTRAASPTNPLLLQSPERLQQIQQLRDAAKANPQRYGGISTAGDTNITICDNGGPLDPAMNTPVTELRASGAHVTIRTCRYSLDELNRTLAEVPASSIFSSNGRTLTRWGIDYDRNAVEVGVDSIPEGFAAKVAALWGDRVYLMVPPAVGLQTGSRAADFRPFFGGDAISSGGTCTSGFTMTNLYGTRYAITAGHCYENGAAVISGGNNFGSVAFRQWGGGAKDNELITGTAYAGRIWVGAPGDSGNTWIPVHSASDSCPGCYVYENGAVGGQSLVQLSGDPYCDNISGVVSCNIQDAWAVSGPGCQPGDSGNPVFAYDTSGGAIAVGIHHAGNGAGYCRYTQLPAILANWTSTITTG